MRCGTYYGATKCSSGPTPGARGAMAWFTGAYKEEGGKNLGIFNCRAVRGGSSTSIHGVGRADDFGTPVTNDWSWNLVELLRIHSEELGIQGIIHRRRQWWSNRCNDGWTVYNGVAAHFDHIHLELTPEAASRSLEETVALWIRVLGDPSPIKGDGHVIAPPVVTTPSVGTWREIAMGQVSELGTRGEQVRQDQANMIDTGFGMGATGADGYCGQASVDGFTLFQRAAGITADGKCGDQTRAMLRKVPSYPGTGIRPYQQKLRDRGWKLAVDGIPGPVTERTLRAFQQEKGLSPDGKPGPMTWTALWTRSL
jgi:hypothetical protein